MEPIAPSREKPPLTSDVHALLNDIEQYCLVNNLAETTFGRRAVNDGKLCQRLREGKGITLKTINRIRSFIHPTLEDVAHVTVSPASSGHGPSPSQPAPRTASARRPFRFYDNRQKYLGFVNTTDEK
ncbi:MAG: hypothetical protein VW546_10355, partial [Gammaproteobacteria bacterium]